MITGERLLWVGDRVVLMELGMTLYGYVKSVESDYVYIQWDMKDCLITPSSWCPADSVQVCKRPKRTH